MDTAQEIWQELKERFYQGDVFRISDIQEEIYTLKQGDCSVSTYYTKMKKICQELDNFRPIPDSCNDACKVLDKMRSYGDSDQVIRFLKGLNDQYGSVRSQIMLMEPLPNIGKVYSLLVQQERQSLLQLDESKILAASSHYPSRRGSSSQRGRGDRGGKPFAGRGKGKGKGNKYCTHCGLTNHVIEQCFKKYGYPPHMQQRGTVNNVHTDGDDEDSKSIAYEDDTGESDANKLFLFFTPDHHKALLALLQKPSSSQSHSVNHITTQVTQPSAKSASTPQPTSTEPVINLPSPSPQPITDVAQPSIIPPSSSSTPPPLQISLSSDPELVSLAPNTSYTTSEPNHISTDHVALRKSTRP
ncbi:hypothetical protein L195_g018620 [Trifolium pratense]|uniref:Retrotransposon gag domain-containing protein n=1 Tax=Trifolium pratense TaxID=57577 RepID=A0A2K3MXA0_TRIPR|nr:hypothetical protein L195_g018620 [Trifolium pratense]